MHHRAPTLHPTIRRDLYFAGTCAFKASEEVEDLVREVESAAGDAGFAGVEPVFVAGGSVGSPRSSILKKQGLTST